MIFDILGWIGMVLVLLAYALLSTNKIENGKLYQGLNLIAAVLMAIGLFPSKDGSRLLYKLYGFYLHLLLLLKQLRKSRKM